MNDRANSSTDGIVSDVRLAELAALEAALVSLDTHALLIAKAHPELRNRPLPPDIRQLAKDSESAFRELLRRRYDETNRADHAAAGHLGSDADVASANAGSTPAGSAPADEESMGAAADLRRLLLRNGCEVATTPDQLLIWRAITVLERSSGEPCAQYPAIWLRTEGAWAIVAVEVDTGKERRWVDVIRESKSAGMSHIVEPLCIQGCIKRSSTTKAEK